MALNDVISGFRTQTDLPSGPLRTSWRSQDAILAAQERDEAFLRAFGNPTYNDDHTTVYGSVSAKAEADRFGQLKGRLAFPIEGRSRVKDWRPEDRGPGLKFTVKRGTLPRAVFQGRVVMVGDFGSLGQAVVIDHGHGYSTVSANLTEVFVEAGARVRAGKVLGELKTQGAEGSLYFELRRQGAPIAPAEWFGI